MTRRSGRSFTRADTVAIPPRSQLTVRLREHLAQAIAGSNRAVSQVAAEFGVAWHTAHRALRGCVKSWLAKQTPQFRAGVGTVVIDPSAPLAWIH